MDVFGGRIKRPGFQWLISALVIAAVWAAPLGVVPSAGAKAGDAAESAPDASAEAADTDADQNDRSGVEIVRYVNEGPYAQSLKMAQTFVNAGDGSSEWVVLASGESWANAATAGPLAASLDAPVVLVPPGGLQTASARPDLVEFLGSTGARRVVIVGSPEALPNHEPSVLFGLGMLPRNIERVHGTDPAGMSVAVAERLGVPADLGKLGPTVIISSDQSVADAVAVGPLAAAGPFPLLLTAPDALDPRFAAYLTEHEIKHVVLVGGTAALAPEVQDAIESAGANVTRLAGRDRSDTARLAADLFEQHTAGNSACNGGPTRIGLVPAQRPEQALTVGPLLAQRCTALRYTEPGKLPVDLRNTLYLARQQPSGVEVLVFGSGSAVTEAVLDVALPPLRLAFVSVGGVTEDDMRSAQIAVVDERGVIRLFPQARVDVPARPFPGSERVCRPHELVWSPAGRFLSYRRLCTPEIFVLDTETRESYQVAFDDSELIFEDLSHKNSGAGWDLYRMGPLWSPAGRSFVFTAFLDDPSTVGTWRGNPWHFAELFVHDVESRTTRRLTQNSVHDLVGSWSPDSKAVGTLRHWEPIASEPYYRVPLISGCLEVSEAATIPRHVKCSSDPQSAWSPDGTQVAYYQEDGWWTRQVAVTTADGSRRRLTPVGCGGCDEYHQHHGATILGWNHSGSMFAFSDTGYVREDGELDYRTETTADYVLDLESGEIRKLFEFTHESYSPAPLFYLGWSPKGDGLLYLRRSEDGSSYRDLVLLDNVTGDITTLRDIPLLQLSFGRQIQPGLLLSPDQSQLLLIYDGTWPRDARPRTGGGMRLTSIQSGDSAPLIDFGPVISMAEGDTPGVRHPARAVWRCETEWSANGILSICG